MASQLISESCSNLRGTLGKNRFPSSAQARSVDVSVAAHYGTSQSSKSYFYHFVFLFEQDLAQASNPLNKPKPKAWSLLRNRAKSNQRSSLYRTYLSIFDSHFGFTLTAISRGCHYV